MPDPIPPSNSAMAVAASALKAQQSRMRVIAENIANAQSTARTPGGEPYRRQMPVFQPREVDGECDVIERALPQRVVAVGAGVEAGESVKDIAKRLKTVHEGWSDARAMTIAAAPEPNVSVASSDMPQA